MIALPSWHFEPKYTIFPFWSQPRTQGTVSSWSSVTLKRKLEFILSSVPIGLWKEKKVASVFKSSVVFLQSFGCNETQPLCQHQFANLVVEKAVQLIQRSFVGTKLSMRPQILVGFARTASGQNKKECEKINSQNTLLCIYSCWIMSTSARRRLLRDFKR